MTWLLCALALLLAFANGTNDISKGIGLHGGGHDVRWKTVRDMLLAWLVTLPVSALLAGAVYAMTGGA